MPVRASMRRSHCRVPWATATPARVSARECIACMTPIPTARLCLDCAAWWRPEPPHSVACYDPEAPLEELCVECRSAVEGLKGA